MCDFIFPDGRKCNSPSNITGSRFCYFHDPNLVDVRFKNRSKAGKNTAKSVRFPQKFELRDSFEFKTSNDVLAAYNKLLQAISKKEIDPKAAKAISDVLDGVHRVIMRKESEGDNETFIENDLVEKSDDEIADLFKRMTKK